VDVEQSLAAKDLVRWHQCCPHEHELTGQRILAVLRHLPIHSFLKFISTCGKVILGPHLVDDTLVWFNIDYTPTHVHTYRYHNICTGSPEGGWSNFFGGSPLMLLYTHR
jgi:hypothetical protein